MKTLCKVLALRFPTSPSGPGRIAKPLGRPPQPDADLVDEIKAVIAETPTYGYRRVWAVLRRAAKAQGLQRPNHKRIYRVISYRSPREFIASRSNRENMSDL